MKYMQNFSSLIPALQGQKAIRRVEKLRELGEVQSEAEYNARLDSILNSLATEEFSPTFVYQPFKPGVSSSEQYNEMMDRLRDDLEVAFIEINNIFTAIKAHDNLFRDKLLDELYYTLGELTKEVNRLKLIADPENAFDDSFANNFSGDLFKLERTDRFANELFFDQRLDQNIQNSNNAFVDDREESLTLPLVLQQDVQFLEASIVNTQTTSSEFDIQLIDSDIQNILVDTQDSNWVYNVLKESPLRLGAKLTIEMDLGDKRLVNYLVLQPISDFPAILDKIEYIDVNNNPVLLPSQNIFGQPVSEPVKISFDDIIAKKFVIYLSQKSSSIFTYRSDSQNLTIDDLRRDTTISASASMVSDQISSAIDNVDLLNVLPINQQVTPESRVLYKYSFGFRNIATGLNGYNDNGYFISQAYSKNTPGLIGLEVDEDMPTFFDTNAGQEVDVGSYEYSIAKRDYNGRGDIISGYDFPILPIGITKIKNERLFFTGNRTTVPLRFLGHDSSDQDIDVALHRNNILLIRGVDWRFADRLNPLNDSDNQLKPQLSSTRIEILHSSDVIRTGTYTAEYTPRHIAEPNSVVSGGPFLTYLSNNITEHTLDRGTDTVENSDLFLKVAIRNNSVFRNKTPKLKSFGVLVSSIDSSKFVRL